METSAQFHLKNLTSYYDTETREIKNQSKIIFTMKIVCPKLDEIAKDQNVESGIEDSDVEKEEDEKDSVKGNDEKNSLYNPYQRYFVYQQF